MAHTHHLHREHQVGHRRVHHILGGEPEGAKKHFHSHAFSKVTSKTAAEGHDGAHHHKVAGHKAPKRYARGGKVKGHHTTVNIINHRPAAPPPAGPMAGAPLPAPPMGGAPGPMPPPGGPPGMGPPGMGGPPGMPPMRARGGKIKEIGGEATKGDLKKWAKHASKHKSYAKGGGVAVHMKAGAATGVGRIEQTEHMKHKGKK
jgi:hypothetical protein